MPDIREQVASLLEKLADGEAVQLGEFSGPEDPQATDADAQAALLRDLADEVRRT